jgi:ParB family chromosome partitioning protein
MQSGIRQEIPIQLLDAYQNHEFTLYTGKRLDDMVDSIESFGVIQPIVVRKKGSRYEILAGHNRTEAAKIVGLKSIPAVIVEADDKLAALIVTETNLVQRSFAEMPISEKSKILKNHCENLRNAKKRKGWIQNLDTESSRTNLSQKESRELVGQEYGLTGRDVSRLIRIGNLTARLQKKVDDKKIPVAAAVDLSYLTLQHQEELSDCLDLDNGKITMKTAAMLRDMEEQGLLFSVSQTLQDGVKQSEKKKKEIEVTVEEVITKLQEMSSGTLLKIVKEGEKFYVL